MVYNPYEAGVSLSKQQRTTQLANEAEKNRQKGVNALADEFGDQALAPNEMSTVRGAERADKQFTINEEQRKINNQRIETQDQISEEERKQQKMLTGLGQIVGGMKQGLKNGAQPQDIVTRFGPVLKNAFGVSDEELLALPQAIADNPALLDDIEGALRTRAGLRVAGLPKTYRLPDGTVETRQVYSDGSVEVTKDQAVPINDYNATQRVAISAQNAETNAEKIRPSAAAILASSKELGKLTAKSVTEQYPKAVDLARGISQSQYAIGLLDKGIKTGSFAEARQDVARFLGTFFGVPDDEITPTDEFVATRGAALADLLATGAFGAGTGVSDNDVKFANKIVAGNIELDQTALRKLINIQVSKSKAQIREYNRRRNALVERNPDFADDYPRVDIPSVTEDEKEGNKPTFDEVKIRVYNPETGRLE